jgi:Fe2+ transport system protein FeoA
MPSQEFGDGQILREILQRLLEFGLMRGLNIPS